MAEVLEVVQIGAPVMQSVRIQSPPTRFGLSHYSHHSKSARGTP